MLYPSYIKLHFLKPTLIHFLLVKFYFVKVLFHFLIFCFLFLIGYIDIKDLHYSKLTINDNEIDIDYFIQNNDILVVIPY